MKPTKDNLKKMGIISFDVNGEELVKQKRSIPLWNQKENYPEIPLKVRSRSEGESLWNKLSAEAKATEKIAKDNKNGLCH